MEKEILVDKMKTVLATVFSFYLKSHNYHWNVTGPNFSEYHNFFGEMYEEVHDSVDLFAEEIRKLGSYTPGSLSRFSELTMIEDETSIPEASIMFARLSRDNDKLIAQLYQAAEIAEELGERGVVNFLEDRISYHEKLRWMLSSF